MRRLGYTKIATVLLGEEGNIPDYDAPVVNEEAPTEEWDRFRDAPTITSNVQILEQIRAAEL
ncbi:hypothetical protein TRL7639_01069 [Falsiruegeria litorea R37]|uniref:Uncharacterized protein n=1 Tax=Falsiruegeria litorea R37 TaxID=1200284 RepID=A0A1Y5RXH6_9RHOB|nr:hypothetical protein [Falsiruegeria litorea]SLN27900.1 hypothetical protein TRL7639_01069 [Falsiruegeria litorea R37]